MRRLRLTYPAALLLMLALLAGCAGTGMVRPETPTESYATAAATLTGVYRSITDLSAAGVITPEKKAKYLARADKLDADRAFARRVLDGIDTGDPVSLLNTLNTTLLALQAELNQEAK